MPITRSSKALKTEPVVVKPKQKPKLIKKQKPKKDDAKTETATDATEAKTIYEFTAKTLNGDEVSLDKFKGHICVIVNVASRCGHTKSNYEQFVELYDKYSESKGLRILAFPCNQFGSQEPGDSEKIREFVEKRNVKFDMFEKVFVNGKNAHPLWKYLQEKIAGPKGKPIKWNFTKFIIDENGNVVERHESSVKPLKLIESFEKLW